MGRVTVLGRRLPEYQVIYINKLLAGVDLSSLKTAIQESQSSVPAGYLEDVAGQNSPSSRIRTANIEQLSALVPDHASGISAQDVTEVKMTVRRGGRCRIYGGRRRSAFRAGVPGANTLALTQAVDAAVRNSVKPASQGNETAHRSLSAGGFY
ncbi:MAG: hypothetical protein ACLT38_10290 [Akkermansia sp.]